MRDLTMVQFRKYTFAISCTDVDVPVLEGAWKGAPVTLTILPYSGMTDRAKADALVPVASLAGAPVAAREAVPGAAALVPAAFRAAAAAARAPAYAS